MPVSELDLVKGGLSDFRMDNLRISAHARQRAKERHIPLEDLRKRKGGKTGFGIQRGNTIVTALTNSMRPPPSAPKPEALRLRDLKIKIRSRIESIGLCPSLHDTPFYTLFWDLFQHHTDPIGKRVKEIVDIAICHQNKRPTGHKGIHNWKDLMFEVTYNDGEKDTISWNKCLDSYLKAYPEEVPFN